MSGKAVFLFKGWLVHVRVCLCLCLCLFLLCSLKAVGGRSKEDVVVCSGGGGLC